MPPPTRSQIRPGLRVNIIQKQNQRSGALTAGIVRRILTSSSTHPHGIKVELEEGLVGRVQAIVTEVRPTDVGQPRRTRLRGVLDRTESSATVRPDGSLVVEFYDFSETADDSFGNDVACSVILDRQAKDVLLASLVKERPGTGSGIDPDGHLLTLMQDRFADYHDVVKWCEKKAIPFTKKFDPRA
ncbi:MAG: YwbE family protein [Candidatus Riflebacteria bacterium]|nr:YwbE family protein [Candidatus Riflebacteria bacterium]